LSHADEMTTTIVEASADGLERSPCDVLRLAVAAALFAVLVLVQWLFGDTLVSFTSQLLRGLDALPTWMLDVLVVGSRVVSMVLLLAGLAAIVWSGRWRVLATVGLAAVLAGVLARAFEDVVSELDPVAATHQGLGWLTNAKFPAAAGLAVATAIVTAGAPWADRGWRRIGWVLVLSLAVARSAVAPISFATLGALLIGWLCGAAALLILGAPLRRPAGAAIAEGLRAVGVPLAHLEQASLDARGSTPYFATTIDGRPLFVKALGADQRSADLLFRVYRSLHRSRLGDERPFSSLRRGVEHEALVALAVSSLGIRTPRFVAFATAEPNAFVLAYGTIRGHSLDRVAPEQITGDVLDGVWQQVVMLRQHQVAHRDLRLANLFLAESGEVWIIDFGFSELAAAKVLLMTDLAELLASTAAVVGAERAVAAGARTVPVDELQAASARLRPWALSGATRNAMKEQKGLLDNLRRRLAAKEQL
jgi:glycosyltransferase 2 family protein